MNEHRQNYKMFILLFRQNKADKSASNSLNPSIFEGLVTLCAPANPLLSAELSHFPFNQKYFVALIDIQLI